MTPATPAKPSTSAVIGYAYKRGNIKAEDAERILERALAAAIPTTIADMLTYARRQMDKDARRYSARAA